MEIGGAMSESERRTTPRHEAVIVVEVAAGDRAGRMGITRNASEKGILMATQARFKPGDRLELTVRAKSGSAKATGRVVRVDERSGEDWRYRVAVELDDRIPDAFIEEGATVAATKYGSMPPPA
jgi:hypothetical protein